MHAETQINNISMIFPATPEKFMQCYGPSGAIELSHLFNMDCSPVQAHCPVTNRRERIPESTSTG
jgi:hypothetical protein